MPTGNWSQQEIRLRVERLEDGLSGEAVALGEIKAAATKRSGGRGG